MPPVSICAHAASAFQRRSPRRRRHPWPWPTPIVAPTALFQKSPKEGRPKKRMQPETRCRRGWWRPASVAGLAVEPNCAAPFPAECSRQGVKGGPSTPPSPAQPRCDSTKAVFRWLCLYCTMCSCPPATTHPRHRRLLSLLACQELPDSPTGTRGPPQQRAQAPTGRHDDVGIAADCWQQECMPDNLSIPMPLGTDACSQTALQPLRSRTLSTKPPGTRGWTPGA